MSENNLKLNIDNLPQLISEPTSSIAQLLIDNLNPKSITVIGSALTDNFTPPISDINTVVVLDNQDITTLEKISALAKPLTKKKFAAPLLMTTDYINQSRDVFAMELLDFQLIHQTILGPDPFNDLTFKKSDLRLQCERELKATLIRLRQGYIAAAGQNKYIRDILISTVKTLTPLLRSLLWLNDIERPVPIDTLFTKTQSQFDVPADQLTTIRDWHYKKIKPTSTQIRESFESIYSITDKLSAIVDKL